MAVRNIAVTDTLETFRTEFNALAANDFGDIANLSGSISATNLVEAMNETISIATSTAGFNHQDVKVAIIAHLETLFIFSFVPCHNLLSQIKRSPGFDSRYFKFLVFRSE